MAFTYRKRTSVNPDVWEAVLKENIAYHDYIEISNNNKVIKSEDWQLGAPEPPAPIFTVDWVSAARTNPDPVPATSAETDPVINFDLNYDDYGVDCALLVVKAGVPGDAMKSITITATTNAPDSAQAVPLLRRNRDDEPYLVSAIISGGVVTCECIFTEPVYLFCEDRGINLLMPVALFGLTKPLHVRVMPM